MAGMSSREMSEAEMVSAVAKVMGVDCDSRASDGVGYILAHTQEYWNPLVSNADAFQVAAVLNMSVDICEYEQTTYAYAGARERAVASVMWYGDNFAATRRAIVLVAITAFGRQK